jgi:hypothetical protein
MLIDFVCKDNIEVLQMMKHTEEKKETKIKEPEFPKPNEKENFLKGLMEFEKVIQIIERCVSDETVLDRIAKMLGINVKPEKTQQP